MRIPYFVFGIYARFLNWLIPIKKKTWAFGADCGRGYRESSKYMLEYMQKEHPDYNCFWVTRSNDVYQHLRALGIPCYINTSFKGIYMLVRAECVFTTQVSADILFHYPKKNRKFFYIGHGMPFKKAFKAVPQEVNNKFIKKNTPLKQIFYPLLKYLTIGYDFDDSVFYVSTSDFLLPYTKMYYGDKATVKVIGLPRNDGLFDHEKMKNESWVKGVDDKFIVTYMPTHRGLGTGPLTPNPFADRPDVQEWMKNNHVVFLMKQHPNMISKLSDVKDTDVMKDITKLRIDPQVCLYHTDVLISDYSSVWIDYLLFNRPLIFYYYDNYEKQDWGQLYDIRQDPPGHFCSSVDKLFELIKRAKEDYDSMRPSESIVRKYHKYVDGKSCERFYDEIIKCLN